MKSSIVIVAAATVLLSVALELESQETRSPRARGGSAACQSLSVSSVGQPASTATRARTSAFSAAEVLDLEFRVVLPARFPGRELELKFFTPKGHLYQTLSVPVARSSSSPAPVEPMENVENVNRRPRAQTVSVRLPVAGTTIVNNSLYGTWKAEAFLEGEATPCVKARSFKIDP